MRVVLEIPTALSLIQAMPNTKHEHGFWFARESIFPFGLEGVWVVCMTTSLVSRVQAPIAQSPTSYSMRSDLVLAVVVVPAVLGHVV